MTNADHASHSGLEDVGENVIELLKAGAIAAFSLTAAGLSMPRLIVEIAFGEQREDCSCHTRHHYRCCYQPPIYKCRG